MLNFKTAGIVAIGALAIGLSVSVDQSEAAIVTFTDRSSFNSQGSIIQNSNFDDFGSGFSSPGNNFTRGGVTYTTTDNLIVGTNTSYSPKQNVFSYNYWSPITGDISTSSNKYSLFGFDLGVDGNPTATIDLTTNKGTFSLASIIAPAFQTLGFFGFKTTEADEYFTGFQISSLGPGNLPGVTNVALGTSNATAVPTPALLPGLIGLGAAALRKRKSEKVKAAV